MHQLLIGGQPSVRGFADTTLSGDTGYFWRNDISLKKQFDVAGSSVNTRFYAGYDFGHVSSRNAEAIEGTMSGMVLGVAAKVGQFDVDLSWIHPVSVPTGMTRESGRVLLSLSFRN
jgi:hemolysin activation/secretion protein